jgi:TusA-related sulfurtransferase
MSEIRLDVRGLPPPEPLMRALEATAALQPGDELLLVTDRRPVHLLPILAERGFEADARPTDDSHELRVRHAVHV